tara:strand:+ start:37 stop:435 length:399 start_codon:yes stop_codon:yes gene_type:complete
MSTNFVIKRRDASTNTTTSKTIGSPDSKANIKIYDSHATNFTIKRKPQQESVPLHVALRTPVVVTTIPTKSRPKLLSPSPQTHITKTDDTTIDFMSMPGGFAQGIRRVGCPCCNPDDPQNVVDMMLSQDGML